MAYISKSLVRKFRKGKAETVQSDIVRNYPRSKLPENAIMAAHELVVFLFGTKLHY